MSFHKFLYKFNILLAALLLIFVAPFATAQTSIHPPERSNPLHSGIESVYEGPGYQIVQFKFEHLSIYSYLVVSDKEALIIDPVRDVSPYIYYAEQNKLKWKGTLLTQTHFDFVAGHREMAFSTGTPVYASSKSKNLFPFIALEDGQTLKLGSISLEVLHTPGHTIDSICVVVNSQKHKKQFLISGDTVSSDYSTHTAFSSFNFSPADMAKMLLNSWNEKLSVLPDSIIILPTHYKNLFCSKKGKYESCSTIGKEKKNNLYLQFHDNKSLFLNKVLCGLKPVSEFSKKVALINQRGPDLVNWDNPFKEQISSLNDFYKDHNFWLFDLNKFKIYKRSHSNGALNISVKDNFESWFPKILGLHSKIVLYGSDELADQIARRLKILGIYSYKLDANFEFKSQPRTLEYIEPDVFYKDYIAKKAAPVLNIYLEDQKVKIETELVINKSVSELDDFLTSKFNTDQKFVLLAGSETSLRLSTAVMERSGFNNFQVFAGGTLAWVEAGLPIMKKNSDFSSSDSAKKAADIKFPLILSIEQLVEDFPEKLIKYSVIDIRSSELAEKYNPLNARRVEVSNLLAEPEKFSAGKPMLIVDSNGTLAFFVAALIAKDSPKQVFVLKDGLQAFWRENIKNKFKFNNPG